MGRGPEDEDEALAGEADLAELSREVDVMLREAVDAAAILGEHDRLIQENNRRIEALEAERAVDPVESEAYREHSEDTFGTLEGLARGFGHDTGMEPGQVKKMLSRTGIAVLGVAALTPIGILPAAIAGAAYVGVRALHSWIKRGGSRGVDEAEMQDHIERVRQEARAEGMRQGAAERAEEEHLVQEEQAQAEAEASKPSPHDMAARIAQSLDEGSQESMRRQTIDDLRHEQSMLGEDHGAEPDPDAIEARELLLLSRSVMVSEGEDGDAARAAVAATESAFISEISKAEITRDRKRLEAIAKRKAALKAQVEKAHEKGTLTDEILQEASEEMSSLRSEEEGIAIKMAAIKSPSLGAIRGLANITVDSTGRAVCYRCGTAPRTVRQKCSSCGMPFVIPESRRDVVGIGDAGLKKRGLMSLIETHEGTSEQREEKWKAWAEGKRVVLRKNQEGETEVAAATKTKSGKKAASKPSRKKAASRSKASARTKKASVRKTKPQREVDPSLGLDEYTKEREAARKEAQTDVVSTALKPFGKDVREAQSAEGIDLPSQAAATVDGHFPIDFGAWSDNRCLRRAQPGDVNLIREEGDGGRAIGSVEVERVIRVDFTPEEIADEKLREAKLNEMWDEVQDRVPSWYTREEFIKRMSASVARGKGKAAIVLYCNPQRFSEPIENASTQQGFGGLSKKHREQVISDYYAREHAAANS